MRMYMSLDLCMRRVACVRRVLRRILGAYRGTCGILGAYEARRVASYRGPTRTSMIWGASCRLIQRSHTEVLRGPLWYEARRVASYRGLIQRSYEDLYDMRPVVSPHTEVSYRGPTRTSMIWGSSCRLIQRSHTEVLRGPLWYEARRVAPHTEVLQGASLSFATRMMQVKHAMTQVKHAMIQVKHAMTQVKHAMTQVKHAMTQVKHAMTQVKHAMTQVKHAICHATTYPPLLLHVCVCVCVCVCACVCVSVCVCVCVCVYVCVILT